jgi:hypothetical protein
MEEQNKYYTPDYNDLVLGDKFQSWHSMDIKRWEDDIFQGWEIDAFKHYISLGAVRVKYLDTDNIISLGWQHAGSHNGVQNYTLSTGDKIEDRWVLRTNTFNNFIDIRQGYEWRRFFGECKSINELRIIHKLLKIN